MRRGAGEQLVPAPEIAEGEGGKRHGGFEHRHRLVDEPLSRPGARQAHTHVAAPGIGLRDRRQRLLALGPAKLIDESKAQQRPGLDMVGAGVQGREGGLFRAGEVTGREPGPGQLIVLCGGVDAVQITVEHVADDLADEAARDVQPVALPDQGGVRQGDDLVARKVVDPFAQALDRFADRAQHRLGPRIGDGDVGSGKGDGERHWRGGHQHLHARISRAHQIDGREQVLQAPRVGQDLEAPAVRVLQHPPLVGRAVGVEARLEVPPGFDQARGDHHGVGDEGLAEDVMDVLAPFDEAVLGNRQGGGHVGVEPAVVAIVEGQGLAIAPGDDPIPVGHRGRPFQALAEGGRMEAVHRCVRRPVILLGRQAEVQHRHPAAQGLEVRLDVAGEATADGENRLARTDAEGRLDLGPQFGVERAGDVLPAGVGVAALASPGLGIGQHHDVGLPRPCLAGRLGPERSARTI